MALMVKSRRARSSSIDSPCRADTSTSKRRSPSSARQEPNASDSGNTGPPSARATAPRHLLGVAGHRKVDVAQRAAQVRVPDDSSHQPRRRPVLQGGAQGPHRFGGLQRPRGHQTSTRGTRAVSPQVTS